MPKFDVKMTFKKDPDGRKGQSTQRHSGKTARDAAEAAVENLEEEYGSDIWDVKVVKVTQIQQKNKSKRGK